MNNLDNKDFAILLALEANPLSTIQELSIKLGIARQTIKKRIKKLRERKIIIKSISFIKPEALGLVRVFIVATSPNWEKLMVLERILDDYPYIRYRSRIFGSTYGEFIIFEIPAGKHNHLRTFFQQLKEVGVVTQYILKKSIGNRTFSPSNLLKYDFKRNFWDFSWDKWFEKFSEINPQDELPTPKINYNLNELKPTHLEIIRELTANADIKQSVLMKKLNLSRAEMSRQYNFVKKSFISNVRLLYKRELFDLTETCLIFAEDVNADVLKAFFVHTARDKPPFQHSLELLEDNGLVFWAQMTANHTASFSFNIWKKIPTVNFYIMASKDPRGSKIFHFHPANFDFKKHSWRTSKAYMIFDPLKSINST